MSLPYAATGFQMIREINVENFRCYEHLKIDKCARLNVIVGPNGVGKTALLESIFLPLCASTEVPVRLRVQRGIDAALGGSRTRIENSLWGDFFYRGDFGRTITLHVDGDGVDNRTLSMRRAVSTSLTLSEDGQAETVEGPVLFKWTDARGHERSVMPLIANGALQFPDTGEDLPDFFHFPANSAVGTGELALHFSDLTSKGAVEEFIETFSKEYPRIADIKLLIHGGSAMLFARATDKELAIPVANISGGINRVLGIQLAIAAHPKSVLTIDEIENGIYYKSMSGVWRGLLHFIRRFDSQIFATTHSLECLKALVTAAAGDMDDIALWRIGRGEDGSPVVRQFNG